MVLDIARQEFQPTVRRYYDSRGRHDLPWREYEPDGSFDPYKIMVSEIMLQQTQVNRVIPKYREFLRIFPTVEALAGADLGAVLRSWNGLGYNRRAKFLHQAARQVVLNYNGTLPADSLELAKLPGIGPNTAGAILAYAFNVPAVFLETNIRTVFIHHFFKDQENISDKALLRIVEETLDVQNPRVWYWALMDYGSFLKQTVGNVSRRGAAYAKQSRFEGSLRQIRGQVIRSLGAGPKNRRQLSVEIGDDRLGDVIETLLREGLIHRRHNKLSL